MIGIWRITAKGGIQQLQGHVPWTSGFDAVVDQWNTACPTALTSGSTGVPVAHHFSMEAVQASAQATAQHFQLDRPSPEVVEAWSALPASGTGGRMMVWRALALGWNLTVSMPSATPQVPAAGTPNGRYHFAVATPMQAAHLMASGQLRRFDILLLGGAPIAPDLEADLKQAADAAGCRIQHGFGMTETLTHVATRTLGEDAYGVLPDVHIDCTEEGALVIDAPRRGVQGLVTQDAVALLPDASLDPQGDKRAFSWLGRIDDVINSGGLKLHPAALERQWCEMLGDILHERRWFIIGRPDNSLGSRVTLVVEGAIDSDLAQQALQALSHEGNKRPRTVEFQAVFKETASGKVRRT